MRIQKQPPIHTTLGNMLMGILLVVFLFGILLTVAAFTFPGGEQESATRILTTLSTPSKDAGLHRKISAIRTVVLVPRDRIHQNPPVLREHPTAEETPPPRGIATGSFGVEAIIEKKNNPLENGSMENEERSSWRFTVVSVCAVMSLGLSLVVANRVVERWIAEDDEDEHECQSTIATGRSDVSPFGYQSCATSWSGKSFDKFDL